jgi:hypothetical protein
MYNYALETTRDASAQQTNQKNSQFKRACRAFSRYAPTLQQNAKATCEQRRYITQGQLAAHRTCSAAAHRSNSQNTRRRHARPRAATGCLNTLIAVQSMRFRAHRHGPRASRPQALGQGVQPAAARCSAVSICSCPTSLPQSPASQRAERDRQPHCRSSCCT